MLLGSLVEKRLQKTTCTVPDRHRARIRMILQACTIPDHDLIWMLRSVWKVNVDDDFIPSLWRRIPELAVADLK